MTKYLIIFLLLTLVNTVSAQMRYEAGILPSLNINTALSKKLKLNFKTESRQRFREGSFSEPSITKYEYILTDFSILLSQKIGLNTSLAGGYLIRIKAAKENTFVHRFIQQFTLVRKHERFRLAHRFSTDQTFSPIETPAFRLRYRITTEIPLNGDKVNHKETYLKINNEYLNELQAQDYDLEIRLVPLLGYVFNDNNKIELGLDYRLNSFVAHTPRSRFWGSLNWFLVW